MKRLTLPLIAVGILTACGGADYGSAQPAAAPAESNPAPASQPADSVADVAAPPVVATGPSAPSSPVEGSGSGQPVNVPEALKFAAPLIGGGDIELTTLAGRPVLLWFWAPW